MLLSELVEEVRGYSRQFLYCEGVVHISEVNDSQVPLLQYNQVLVMKVVMDEPFLELRKINICESCSQIVREVLK